MNRCNVDVEVDLFDYKQKILSKLSNDELDCELKRRIDENLIIQERNTLMVSFDVDIDDYADNIIENYTDSDLQTELEYRGYDVYGDDNIPEIIISSKRELAQIIGLKSHSTKEQILEELNYLLNE